MDDVISLLVYTSRNQSSWSTIDDRNTKADTYAALGVRELWLDDEIAQALEKRVLEGDRYHRIAVHHEGELVTARIP